MMILSQTVSCGLM